MHFVKKGWGSELWIHNGDDYCGKLLKIEAGKRCSLHYHALKSETFYLQSGKLRLRTAPLERLAAAAVEGTYSTTTYDSKDMVAGEAFEVPRYLVHQMLAIEDCELYEFSTTHYDSDSYRLEKGD